MKSSIKSIIGKVVPEGIKNTYRKLLLNRYIQREIEPMLTKYNINNRKNWRRILMLSLIHI